MTNFILGSVKAYITSTFPGIIKAWYLHHRMTDQIAVVSGRMKLVLYDSREDSPSLGRVQTIMVGDLSPNLVQIPPGIWHGFQAIGPTQMFALHLNSEPINLADPDEDRLPSDTTVIPFQW